MRVLLLGTGTCLNPDPGTRPRMPPLFAVDLGTPADPWWLLLDCSEGARWRLPAAGVDAASVRAIALSHPHADHAALPQFLQGRTCDVIHRAVSDPSLALLLPRATAEAMPDLWRWHQPEDGGRPSSRFALRVTALDDRTEVTLGDRAHLTAFAVHHGHGGSPALAFRIVAGDLVLAYSGDTGPCAGVTEAARGADLFLCEASSRVGQDMSAYGHLSPRQAGEVACQAGARRLVLTHYSGHDSDEAMLDDARASGFGGVVEVGHDGDEVQLVTAT